MQFAINAQNQAAVRQRPAVMVCPSDTAQADRDVGGYRAATGSYAMVNGRLGPDQGIGANVKIANTGVFMYRWVFAAKDVLDGTSNTIYFGETYNGHLDQVYNVWTVGSRHETLRSTVNPPNTPPGAGVYTAPYGPRLNGAFASRHPGGVMFAFGDGHVQFISQTINLTTYRALSTRETGEPISNNY